MQWFVSRSGGFVPAGIFPLSAAGFEQLQAAMERLTLNDASGAVPQVCPGNQPGQPCSLCSGCVVHAFAPLRTDPALGTSTHCNTPPAPPPAVTVRRENSNALGAGFRCGFLGLLHMDVSSFGGIFWLPTLRQPHGMVAATWLPLPSAAGAAEAAEMWSAGQVFRKWLEQHHT